MNTYRVIFTAPKPKRGQRKQPDVTFQIPFCLTAEQAARESTRMSAALYPRFRFDRVEAVESEPLIHRPPEARKWSIK